MTVELFVFYLLAAVTVASGVMVVSARNPVHSVLFLILAFFNSAGLFVLIGAEFLAMILVVVYVGAVAVLFMFVVMMLDINFLRLQEGFMRYLPVGAADRHHPAGRAGAGGRHLASRRGTAAPACRRRPAPAVSNTEAIGNLLYTHYFYLFQTAGMILLVAIIGAITLTLRHRPVRAAGHRRPGQPAARRDGRAAQGALGERRLMAIPVSHYLTLAAILFTTGVFGIFLNRKNVIIILMSIELILLAVNINFVAFSACLDDLAGQIFAMFILTVAAGEAAIGLAIVVVYFRNRGSIEVDDINLMRG